MYKPQKFTEYYKISNEDIDFVDIYINRDLPLFLDPFGISALRTPWAKECENQIATYFQYLIDSIRNGDNKSIKKLLNALHEVNEIALGYSSDSTRGRGIGKIQAQQMLESFQDSEAAKSGDIKDIADCALLIPGISRDKISDITANILKRQLVFYTQEQCEKHRIPMKKVAVNNAFDYDSFTFSSYYALLPVINGQAKILLPQSAVRQDPELSRDKYYRNFVLEYLQAEHERAGDSLATVLRNGKVVVRIMDLKQKYPNSIDFLYQFNKDNPQILERYKQELRSTALSNQRAMLKPKRKILNAIEKENILNSITSGNNDASRFHDFIYKNLIDIFSYRVSKPKKESPINEGRKRIDITFNNADKGGFFHSLHTKYQIKSPKIFIECKNYGKELGNPEIDQLAGRLNDNRGRFGILVCRNISDKDRLIRRCKDSLYDNKNYIIVLEDKDIIQLIRLLDTDNQEGIDDLLESKIDELIM